MARPSSRKGSTAGFYPKRRQVPRWQLLLFNKYTISIHITMIWSVLIKSLNSVHRYLNGTGTEFAAVNRAFRMEVLSDDPPPFPGSRDGCFSGMESPPGIAGAAGRGVGSRARAPQQRRSFRGSNGL